jgi:hypothetical protein
VKFDGFKDLPDFSVYIVYLLQPEFIEEIEKDKKRKLENKKAG